MRLRSGYYNRDAASLLRLLPASSVDVTITSPPYGSLKNYGDKRQIGYGQSYEIYLNALTELFGLVYEKTKDSGSLWIVVDTFREKSRIRLLPFDLADRLKGHGWQLQDIIIWNKTKTLPWSRLGQLRKTFEYILFFTKTRKFKYFVNRIKELDDLKEWWVRYPERYSPEGKVPTAIWTYPIPVQGSWSKIQFRHFCPFPTELVQRILLLTTEPGDCVLDPFAGSGVVLAQGKVMHRKVVGCDVNASYRDHFYRIITNHIGKKWNSHKKLNAETDAERERLADTIRKLRQVKFPKTLFKELHRSISDSQLAGVRAILAKAVPLNGHSSKHTFCQVLVYFLCDKHTDLELIEQEGRSAIKRPPLSKYGILAEVHARRALMFWKSREGCLLAGQNLFLYAEGITYSPEREIKTVGRGPLLLPDWKRVPPIITNVWVRQRLVRTWVPRRAGQRDGNKELGRHLKA